MESTVHKCEILQLWRVVSTNVKWRLLVVNGLKLINTGTVFQASNITPVSYNKYGLARNKRLTEQEKDTFSS